jgi:ATP-binding cassette subfamily C (CFTR/MRP) protein 1
MLYCIQRWLGLALDSMVAVCAILIITLATQQNRSASNSGGALGVALVNLFTLSNILSYLICAWTDLETSIGAVLRVREFESFTPSEIVLNASQELPGGDWPQYGAIKFQNVHASYSIPSVSSEVTDRSLSSPALKDITLSIPPGSHVGICGRTGSGKSSLILTLFHLVEINSGVLSVDDVEIRNLNRSTLRSRLVAVPQSPELFPGTLRSNLDPASHFTDDTIINELKESTYGH